MEIKLLNGNYTLYLMSLNIVKKISNNFHQEFLFSIKQFLNRKCSNSS